MPIRIGCCDAAALRWRTSLGPRGAPSKTGRHHPVPIRHPRTVPEMAMRRSLEGPQIVLNRPVGPVFAAAAERDAVVGGSGTFYGVRGGGAVAGVRIAAVPT